MPSETVEGLMATVEYLEGVVGSLRAELSQQCRRNDELQKALSVAQNAAKRDALKRTEAELALAQSEAQRLEIRKEQLEGGKDVVVHRAARSRDRRAELQLVREMLKNHKVRAELLKVRKSR